MTLNEYRRSSGMIYKDLGEFLKVSMWTARKWCDDGLLIEFDGNYVKVKRPEKVVHKTRRPNDQAR